MRLRSLSFIPALLLTSFYAVNAQEVALSGPEQVRLLNSKVLHLHGQTREGGGRATLALRAQAVQVLRERANKLGELIETDPAQALAIGFSEEAGAQLTAEFPEASEWIETHGEWQGPAEYVVLDDSSLKRSKSEVTMGQGEGKLQVHFANTVPQGLKCGSMLRVKGMKLGTHIVASAAPHVTTSASAGSCSPIGVQKIAVILVTFPGVTPPVSASAVYNVFFGTGRSVDGYWRDASYSQTSATGNVFGWYTLPTAYTCDQYAQLGSAAMTLADPDVVFTNYNRIFYVFPRPSGCTYGGISTVGCTAQSSADGSFTASNSWLIADYLSPNDQGVELAIHEGGHGLTLNHAQSRGFGTEALGALGTSGTFSEYGDNFDPMGYYNLGHYGMQHKVQLGWVSASNVLTVQGSGTYSVAPIGTQTASPQALKVQRGTGNPDWLWIEYHQPVGNYESALSSQVFSGATIRYQDSFTGTGYSNLLNYNPQSGSWYYPALAAGSAWTDPYTNVSLTVNSATSSALNLAVNYGAVPCTHAAPKVSMTPSNPTVNPGAVVPYTLTVVNNDSSSCAATAFSISASGPAGWGTSLSTTSVTLAPGQNTSVTVTETVPTTTAPATYAVSAGISGTTGSTSSTAYCSVISSPPLTASIISKTGTDANRDWKLQIFNSGSAVASAAQISKMTFTQTGGPACSPALLGTFPLQLGDIPASSSVLSDVFINFTGCQNSAKFTVNIVLSANGGASTSTVIRNNERK